MGVNNGSTPSLAVPCTTLHSHVLDGGLSSPADLTDALLDACPTTRRLSHRRDSYEFTFGFGGRTCRGTR